MKATNDKVIVFRDSISSEVSVSIRFSHNNAPNSPPLEYGMCLCGCMYGVVGGGERGHIFFIFLYNGSILIGL